MNPNQDPINLDKENPIRSIDKLWGNGQTYHPWLSTINFFSILIAKSNFTMKKPFLTSTSSIPPNGLQMDFNRSSCKKTCYFSQKFTITTSFHGIHNSQRILSSIQYFFPLNIHLTRSIKDPLKQSYTNKHVRQLKINLHTCIIMYYHFLSSHHAMKT